MTVIYAAVSAALKGISRWREREARVEACQKKLTYEVIKLDCGYTLVDTRDDFLCDCCSVNMVGVEAITQSRNTSCDFVELDTLLATVWRVLAAISSKECKRIRTSLPDIHNGDRKM